MNRIDYDKFYKYFSQHFDNEQMQLIRECLVNCYGDEE